MRCWKGYRGGLQHWQPQGLRVHQRRVLPFGAALQPRGAGSLRARVVGHEHPGERIRSGRGHSSGRRRYICGEETALLTSLEGGKGFPKLKPPFPASSGLFHCPTIVNNVETLACVPFILREGVERFADLGSSRQGGTRLFSVCGHVRRPGLYEAPVGVSLRELIEGYAQGVREGRTLKAVVPGGISAKVLTAAEIESTWISTR